MPGPSYHNCDRAALQNFKCCQNRVRDGKVSCIDWPRTREGYLAFLKEIGPKPNDDQKWSVGRKSHKKGYVKGNIRWELHKFNSVKRRGTKHENSRRSIVKLNPKPKFKRGSPENRQQIIRALRKRWRDPKQHQMMSERLLGNNYAKGKRRHT